MTAAGSPEERAPDAERGGRRWGRVWRRWRECGLLLVAMLIICGATGTSVPAGDVTLYQRYAEAALRAPLFHLLPKEYPALSVLVFLVPHLVPGAYAFFFALLAGGATVTLVLSTDGRKEFPAWSWRACVYLLVGALGVVFARYDVFPVLAAVLALEGARRQRWGRAWAWAVVGGLLKLFPFLLLPGFLIIERRLTGRWAWRRAAVCVVPMALVAAVQSVLAPGSLVSPLRYELRRGLELSSLQGSLSFLVDPLHVHWSYVFSTQEVVGHGQAVIGVVVAVLAVASLTGIWITTAKGYLTVEATSLAVVSVAVLVDKAFAAQYIIWLIPLWAYWPLRRSWLAAAALTTVVYPFMYYEASYVGPGYYGATSVAVVRNAVLVAGTLAWFVGQVRQGKAASTGPVEARVPAPGTIAVLGPITGAR